MLVEILRLDHYAYSFSAIPTLVALLIVTVVGTVTYWREQRTRAVVPFITICVGVFVWMFGATIMFLSLDEDTAIVWAKFASAGTIFLPASIYFFAASVAERTDSTMLRVLTAYAAAVVFLITLLLSPLYLAGVTEYSWDYYPYDQSGERSSYYPVYGPVGFVFAIYLVALFAASLRLLWRAYKSAKLGTSARQRIRLVFIAESIALFAAIDLLPAFGVSIYPVGLLFVLTFLAVISRVTTSYHFIDITPALAGQAIIDTISEALIVVSEEGVIRLVNPATLTLLNCSEMELLGSRFSDKFKVSGSDQIHEELLRGGTLRNIETKYRTPHGQARIVSVSASAMRGSGRKPIALIYVLRDITQRKRAEARIRYLAYNDALTQLPNRVQFDQTLRRAVGEHKVRAITTLFVDLDRFKRVNDSLGHDAGDELLLAAANRLKLCLRRQRLADEGRGGSMIARIGGDEFAIGLFGVNEISQIREIAQRVIETLAHPFALHGEEVRIGASIGISIYPRDGRDPETLLKNADRAMYHAKQAGRGNYHFYNSTMDAVGAERLQLEKDLRVALEREEFQLYYQPQVDVRTGHVFACEALLRWQHPERGTILPMEFVPLAEEDGTIAPIGRWVLRQACVQVQKWHAAGFGELHVAVNISARQLLRGRLVAEISECLEKAGLQPKYLQLELTETILMENADQAIGNLVDLKTMGVSIAIDDFGTGYSSLSYLKRLPIDVIKIDRSFIRDITTDAEDLAITTAIIALAHSLHRQTVAEGVETHAQMELLRAKGCNLMQGYLFGKACRAEDFTAILARELARRNDTEKIVEFPAAISGDKPPIQGF